MVDRTRLKGLSDTDLADPIGASGTPVLVAGLMTHNSFSSTLRAAPDLGHAIMIAGDFRTMGDFPSKYGVFPAAMVQATELEMLADRYAVIAPVVKIISD